jgi:hypothetical protein
VGKRIVAEYVVAVLGLRDAVLGEWVRTVVEVQGTRGLGGIAASSVVVQMEGDVPMKSPVASLLVR